MQSTTVEFQFAAFDYVRIDIFGMSLRGRVMRCIWNGEYDSYLVQYLDSHGDLDEREFYPDQLVPTTEEGVRT